MEYKHNALEIVSAASKRFTQPLDATPEKIAVHIKINNNPSECYKIEFERGKFSLYKGHCSEPGGEDLSLNMSVLTQDQDNLGKISILSGEKVAAEYENLDHFWDSMFKTC